MALEINTAGLELVKSVLSLYRTVKYFREKEILAKKLVDSSLEAGRLITEVSVCPEEKENKVAKQALEELSRALFILKVMESESIYSTRRVQPVEAIMAQVKELLELYVTEEDEEEESEAPHYGLQPVQSNGEQLSFLTDINDGGFNDIYYGKLL